MSWRTIRDAVTFMGGILGIAHETIVNRASRPELLLLFGGMIGLPAFLNSDEKKASPPDDSPKRSPARRKPKPGA